MKILYSIFIYILFSNFILSNSNKISIKKEIKTKKINFKKNSFNIKTKLRQLTEEEENEIEEEEENEEEDENLINLNIEFEENLINEEFEEKNENEEEDLDLIKEYKDNEYEEDDFIEEENEKRNDKEEEEEDNEEENNKNEEYDEHIIEEDEEENENKNKENEENEYEEKEEENEFELEENDNENEEKEIEENEYEYEEEEEEKKENEENEYEEKENDEKIDEEKEEEENEYEKKEEEEEKEIEIEENDKEYEEIEIEENESEEKEYEEKEVEENEYDDDEVYYYQINTKLPICQSQDNINLIFENINSKDILDGTFQLNLNSSSEMGISIIDCINENNNQKIYCNLTREKEDIEYNITNFTYDKNEKIEIEITGLKTLMYHIKFIKQIDFAEKQETIQKIDDSKFNFNIILISEVNSPPLFVLKKNGENILGNPNCVINNNKIIQCSYEDLELLKNNNGDYEVYYINPCNEIKMNITVQITTQNTHRKFGSSQFIKSLFFNLLFISFFLV